MWFYVQEVGMKTSFFHYFSTSTHTQSLWPKLKTEILHSFFSGKHLIDTLSWVNHSEIIVVTMSFHLHSAWETLIWNSRCLENENDYWDFPYRQVPCSEVPLYIARSSSIPNIKVMRDKISHSLGPKPNEVRTWTNKGMGLTW